MGKLHICRCLRGGGRLLAGPWMGWREGGGTVVLADMPGQYACPSLAKVGSGLYGMSENKLVTCRDGRQRSGCLIVAMLVFDGI